MDRWCDLMDVAQFSAPSCHVQWLPICERNNCLQQISNGQICDNFYWLWRSQYVSNNLSFLNPYLAVWKIYSPIYDLLNEHPLQDLWISWKQPIRDFPSPTNVQLKSTKCPIDVLHIYSGKRWFASVMICSIRVFIYGSHKTALNHFVLILLEEQKPRPTTFSHSWCSDLLDSIIKPITCSPA